MAYRSVLAVVTAFILVAGCSKSLGPEERRAVLIEEGWALFGEGDYAGAEERFRRAAEIENAGAEVYLGLGWSSLRRKALSAASTNLVRISARDTAAYPHAQTGLAVLYDAQGAFDRSIGAALAALQRDTNYVFVRDPRVDWRDLCFLLSKNYLILSSQADPDLSRSLRHLSRIDSGPPILATDSTTWTAQGQRYPTLGEAIVKRLESLQRAL